MIFHPKGNLILDTIQPLIIKFGMDRLIIFWYMLNICQFIW